jgi:diaminopimelate epimerase
MILPFTKMQGVGNDFILVDAREVGDRDWAALSPSLCHRRLGIGSDGLLIIESAPNADAAMRMFNPDGTEDFCGNGLRCVARFVWKTGKTQGACRTRLSIATVAGLRAAEIHPDATVTVEMGLPVFDPRAIPVKESVQAFRRSGVQDGGPVELCVGVDGEEFELFCLSTGTTHSVVFVEELPDDDRFLRVSPKLEHHPVFPERTSVMWTQVEEPGRLRLRIWERGVGETWGCGSGACAAAVAARCSGLTGDETVVSSKGGELSILWDGEDVIRKTGPAEIVFRGDVEI